MPEPAPPDSTLPQLAAAPGAQLPEARVDYAMPAYGPVASADGGMEWGRYWAVIVRHRWWVVLGTVLGFAAGAAAAFVIKPQYYSQATLWLDAENRSPDAYRGPIRPEQLLQATSWVDLLKTYTVLDEVVREMRLYVTPGSSDTLALASFGVADRFRPGRYHLTVDTSGHGYTLFAAGNPILEWVFGKGGVAVERGSVGDSVGRSVGFRWAPPAAALRPRASISFTLVTPRDAAKELSDALTIALDLNGNFLKVALLGKNPVSIAATVNALTARYLTVAADLKRAKLVELTHILNDQLTTAAANLRNAEGGLQSFRVNTITLPSEPATPLSPGLEQTRDPVFANFFQMRIEREQLRRDREAMERVLAQLPDSALAVEALEVIGAVQRSTALLSALRELTSKEAELRALRYKYTDTYPPVQRLAGDIETLARRTIPGLAGTLIAEIATREQVLDTLGRSAGHELQEIPARAVEEGRLRREVAIAENLYTLLQQRYEEARLAEASTIPDVRVLDSAVAPQVPVKNTTIRFMLLGLFGGVGVSVAGVLAVDRLDRRVRYPHQITQDMGLVILGALPRLKQRGGVLDRDDATQALEALRTVRLNAAHAYGTGPMVLTISSPGAGDGKSFLASNLARAYADAGRRTLLIDGDTRRGVLHRVLKAQRKPGLVDYLMGVASLDAVVQQTDHPSLGFIASGTRREDAPELLGSPAMVTLIAAARSAYQVILIDSPPLGAGVDPFILGTLAGSLLLVLRTGSTDRALAQAKLEVVARLPIRMLGAVLNDVEPQGMYRYYTYLSGYAAEDEPLGSKRWSVAQRLPGGSVSGAGR